MKLLQLFGQPLNENDPMNAVRVQDNPDRDGIADGLSERLSVKI
jgi:hypothetical protein